MSSYILRRLLAMFPTLLIISVVVFILIQLPPGDIITANLASLQQQGMDVSAEQILALRKQYNLDQPMPLQYLHWIFNFVQGDMDIAVSARVGRRGFSWCV